MAWFFAQVWALCVAAFLLGTAATWWAFVRPLRQARVDEADASWSPMPNWPAPQPVVRELAARSPEPVRPRTATATDPALAALDGVPRRPTEPLRQTAADALAELGVSLSIPAQVRSEYATTEIPVQAGPRDNGHRRTDGGAPAGGQWRPTGSDGHRRAMNPPTATVQPADGQ